MNEGDFFNYHRGFDTEEEALDYFIERYPRIRSMADIRFMNGNVPLKASNLSNPYQYEREAMAHSSSQHLKEAFHVEALTPEVRIKREVVLARMHAQGLQPEDSYDFFDAHHPQSNQTVIDISPMQNLIDLTGFDSDDGNPNTDGTFCGSRVVWHE